jgi:hypothetical protein
LPTHLSQGAVGEIANMALDITDKCTEDSSTKTNAVMNRLIVAGCDLRAPTCDVARWPLGPRSRRNRRVMRSKVPSNISLRMMLQVYSRVDDASLRTSGHLSAMSHVKIGRLPRAASRKSMYCNRLCKIIGCGYGRVEVSRDASCLNSQAISICNIVTYRTPPVNSIVRYH